MPEPHYTSELLIPYDSFGHYVHPEDAFGYVWEHMQHIIISALLKRRELKISHAYAAFSLPLWSPHQLLHPWEEIVARAYMRLAASSVLRHQVAIK